jgi:hypothetical protein
MYYAAVGRLKREFKERPISLDRDWGVSFLRPLRADKPAYSDASTIRSSRSYEVMIARY